MNGLALKIDKKDKELIDFESDPKSIEYLLNSEEYKKASPIMQTEYRLAFRLRKILNIED